MSDIFTHSAQKNADDADRIDGSGDEKSTVVSGQWRIETLKSLADIRQNALRWVELEAQSIDPQAVFQGVAWCETWAEVYCKAQQNSYEPRVFFISQGTTLAAILPLMLETHMGTRVLTLFGEPHSQIANVLTHSNIDTTDGLRLCLAQAVMLAGADVMALGPIPDDSPLLNVAEKQHLSADPAECLSVCQWPNGQTVENHLMKLSKNSRKNFNRKSRQIEEMGNVRFQRFTPLDNEFKPAIRQALNWKRDWLERNGTFSLGLSTSGVDEFLSSFSGRDTVFQPNVDVLFLNDDPISISINMTGNGIRHSYLSSHDHKFQELSPGTLATHIAIHESILDKQDGYSFLGFPTPFKATWSNKHIPLWRYHHALSLRGKIWLQVWTRGLRPMAKHVLTYTRRAAQTPVLGKVLNEFLNLLSKQRGNG